MAAKKNFYAVRKGKTTGIFANWEECKESITGCSGAVYQGFVTRAEAEAYLAADSTPGDAEKQEQAAVTFPYTEDALTVYVDGSFDAGNGVYGFGCIFLTWDSKVRIAFGNGHEEDTKALRNVAGEMLGAMYAVQVARKNGYKSVDICYDYAGIEQWATGGWKTNKELTKKYADAMQAWATAIEIRYHKVAAHTNQTFNELADKAAKRGVKEGQGVPPLAELSSYEEIAEEEWNGV